MELLNALSKSRHLLSTAPLQGIHVQQVNCSDRAHVYNIHCSIQVFHHPKATSLIEQRNDLLK